MGLGIGADVPFCIRGGTALGEGVGGTLSPLPASPDHHLLLIKPDSGAETARIYKAYDEHPPERSTPIQPLVSALQRSDLHGLAGAVGNDLAPITKAFVPEVAQYERDLLGSGALGASMSGSGTAVYGIFATEEEAQAAASRLKAPFAGIYKPVSCGVEMVRF